MNIYAVPPNTETGDVLYAYMSEDKDGKRGVIGAITPNIGHTPLVTLSPKVVELLRPLAEETARNTGVKVVLATFRLETIKLITPGGKS
jgi:hypothetical protein